MNEETITSLAREYAQPYGLQCNPDNVEEVIRFLLRRFCLVEKSKVLKSLIQARALIEVGRRNHDNIKEDLGTGSERTIYCLFPEIGKEVEE